jgi:DNA-directed RNA polymerase specialized sigma24 family protein
MWHTSIQQNAGIIRKAFQELSEKQQRTLSLFFFEGYTLREISRHVQESLANTRHHYYRGLKNLKENLDLVMLRQGPRKLNRGF